MILVTLLELVVMALLFSSAIASAQVDKCATMHALKESIKQLDGPTREMYDALVERAVAEYAAKKDLAEDFKNHLIRRLKKKWKEIEKDLKK